MITIDTAKCVRCGACLRLRGGYCLSDIDGVIQIDYSVCSDCQKCVAVCPRMAFSNNGRQPVRIEKSLSAAPEDVAELMRRRRSIRHFKDAAVPRELLARVAAAGAWAPTMNKAIEALIADDPAVLKEIDEDAMRFYMRFYRLLFGVKPALWFFKLFSDTLPVIRKKMEHDLIMRRQILKDNTQALILLIGRPKVPLTEVSAQYYLANMLLYAEAEGLGTCLMDAFKISTNRSSAVKKLLNIPKGHKILGVLALGYPDEVILNIPEGYEMKTSWNRRG